LTVGFFELGREAFLDALEQVPFLSTSQPDVAQDIDLNGERPDEQGSQPLAAVIDPHGFGAGHQRPPSHLDRLVGGPHRLVEATLAEGMATSPFRPIPPWSPPSSGSSSCREPTAPDVALTPWKPAADDAGAMGAPADIQAASGGPVASGRAALTRGDWEEARLLFEAAVAVAETSEAVEGLSWAVWWLNDAAAVFELRERAFNLYRSEGNQLGAARMACWLGTDHADFRGELAVAQGWHARARRLLEGLEPGPEHGWLYIHEAEKHLFAHNDTARARELGAAAAELGRRLGVVDLEMMGLATEGLALVTEGAVTEGVPRMDEAAAAALGGEFPEVFPTIWCCCYMIFACERLRDYDRAAQWCKRFEEWSERMRVPFANRLCRAHYAGILVRRGVWDKAEAELTDAAARLAEIRPPMAAEAIVRLGELRRRQGRLDEAAEMFASVEEHPLAVVGLGEVCLDRGDAAGACDRAEQYLREAPPHTAMLRAAGLELLVRARAALGGGSAAAAALDELDAIADRVGADPLRASASFCGGVLAAAAGDHHRARTAFEDATRLFLRSGAPFEAARARLELARVLEGLGRRRDAAREARSAATSLGRIRADHAAALAEELALDLEERPARDGSRLTARERQVLALVAGGKSDRTIAGELVLSEHTVHRHVANILTKLGCATRSAAVAEALRQRLI
jgi:DNA-binding CsgD family transcriptional regulator